MKMKDIKNDYKIEKVVEVTGLEPTASASRTQRSTKLSHTSIYAASNTALILYNINQKK